MADEGRQLEETEKYLNPYWVLSTENTNAEKILINRFFAIILIRNQVFSGILKDYFTKLSFSGILWCFFIFSTILDFFYSAKNGRYNLEKICVNF